MSTTAESIATPADPIDGLRDFPDRLSPILVKELRQGLRQASFVIMFLFLQGVMAMAVIGALCAVSTSSLSNRVEMGNVISGSFFCLFGLAVVVIQPMRALTALSTEIRDNTIDLLLLTRLNAWGIVYGKWLCLITQSGLLLVAILPYLMMRYFLGGMNLFMEMAMLAAMFLIGGMICAGGVAMSAVRSLILRAIFAVVGVIAFIYLLIACASLFVFSSMGARSMGWLGFGSSTYEWIMIIVGGLLLIAFLTYSALEFAATRIAPPAENRSRRKRLIAIGALIVIPLIFAVSNVGDYEAAHFAILIIAPISLADALSENPRYVRPAGRRESILLRPGWPCGTIYGLLMVLACALWQVVIALLDGFNNANNHLEFAQATAICLLIVSQPPLLMALIRPKDTEPANIYLTCVLGSMTLGLVLMIISAVSDSHEWVCNLLYPFFPILGLGTIDDPSIAQMIAAFVCCILYLLAAGIIGLVKWRQTAPLIAPPANPPAA